MIETSDMILVYLLRGGNYAAALMEEYADDMKGADELSETTVRRALKKLEESNLISRVMTERGWWVPVEENSKSRRTLGGRALRYSYLTKAGLARARLVEKGLRRILANQTEARVISLAQKALDHMQKAKALVEELTATTSKGYTYGLTEEGARTAKTVRNRIQSVLDETIDDDDDLVDSLA